MNRTRILTVLLVLLCAALVYAWVATPKQKRLVDGQGAMQPVKQKASVLNLVAPEVDGLDFSQGLKTAFRSPEKSLFAPLYLPPKPVKSRPLPPPKINKPRVVAPVTKAEPVGMVVKDPEPILPLNVLGFLNKEREYTVFLASAPGEVYVVKLGDNFSDGLSVAKITPQEITILRRATAQQVVLQIGKIKSQRLPSVGFNSGRPKFETPAEPSKENKAIKLTPTDNPFTNAIKKTPTNSPFTNAIKK